MKEVRPNKLIWSEEVGSDRIAARPDGSHKLGPKVVSLNPLQCPRVLAPTIYIHSVKHTKHYNVFLAFHILYPPPSPRDALTVGVILIRSRYCVLYIPPCQQTSYCSFLGSFSLHLYYIPSPQCNFWLFTFLDQMILGLKDHHFPGFRTGFVVNWSQKWISSGFAHISSGPDKLENLGRYISWIRFIYTVIYSIVKKSCSHFQWLAPILKKINDYTPEWLKNRRSVFECESNTQAPDGFVYKRGSFIASPGLL